MRHFSNDDGYRKYLEDKTKAFTEDLFVKSAQRTENGGYGSGLGLCLLWVQIPLYSVLSV